MKRLICCLMTVCLLMGCACAEETEAERLRDVWQPCWDALSDVYQKALWALDYVDAFLENPNWETMSKAKAACALLMMNYNSREFPELSLSDDELAQLRANGHDVNLFFSFMRPEMESEQLLEFFWYTALPAMDRYGVTERSRKELQAFSALTRERILCDCKEFCWIMNGFFLPLFEEGEAEAFWAECKEQNPVLFADCDPWYYDQKALEDATNTATNEWDILFRWEKAFSTMDSLHRSIAFQRERGQDVAFLSMDGAPAPLPMPSWYDPTLAIYGCYSSTEGDMVMTKIGSELTMENSWLQVVHAKVDREDVLAYVDSLRGDYIVSGDPDGFLSIRTNDYTFGIKAKDGNALIIFIGESTAFAW